jgi:lipoyl(octanoyl) transferase
MNSVKDKHNINFQADSKSINYPEAFEFMENYALEIASGTKPELIWLTSHQSVYTAGVSAKDKDLLDKNIPVYKSNRGGQYTYHDEGMRIIYTMINLKNCFAPQKPDVSKFVEMLENWVIAILAKLGIKGEIKKGRVGIWVLCADNKEKKIAAIGIKLKKWVSYHGIAININPNLEAFKAIVPCGLKDFGVTSISDLGGGVSLQRLDQIIQEEFFKIFTNYQDSSLSFPS